MLMGGTCRNPATTSLTSLSMLQSNVYTGHDSAYVYVKRACQSPTDSTSSYHTVPVMILLVPCAVFSLRALDTYRRGDVACCHIPDDYKIRWLKKKVWIHELFQSFSSTSLIHLVNLLSSHSDGEAVQHISIFCRTQASVLTFAAKPHAFVWYKRHYSSF